MPAPPFTPPVTQPPRYRPVTPKPPTPGAPPQQTPPLVAEPGPAAMPPGGYNNPANAPQNDPSGLPPKPPKGQTFGYNKAQHGVGPANNTTPVEQRVPPPTPTVNTTSSATLPPPQYRPVPITPPKLPQIATETVMPTTPTGLRGDTYTPGGDPRLSGLQTATDLAYDDVQDTRRQPIQQGMEDRYRSVFGTGQIDPNDFATDTDARFRSLDTKVTAGSVDPNVAFKSIDPRVQARDATTQVARGPEVQATESARTSRYGAAQDQALEGLGGPDRTALAKQKLQDFDAVSDEQRFKEERALGQNIAKFGRSGMQSNAGDFGEITRKIAGDRGRLANELAADVAEGDINDRFRRVDATAGLRGQESGIDAGLRGESRTERQYGTNVETDNVNRGLDDRDYRTGLDERNIGRSIGERDSALGLGERNVGRAVDERNFRAGLDSENMDRARNERDLESALEERNIGRRAGERDTRLGIATGNQDRAFDRTSSAINAATSQTDRNMGDIYDRFNAVGSLEDRVFDQGESNRNEFRAERQRQDQQSQQTIENRLREFEVQQQLEDNKIRRAAALQQAGGAY